MPSLWILRVKNVAKQITNVVGVDVDFIGHIIMKQKSISHNKEEFHFYTKKVIRITSAHLKLSGGTHK